MNLLDTVLDIDDEYPAMPGMDIRQLDGPLSAALAHALPGGMLGGGVLSAVIDDGTPAYTYAAAGRELTLTETLHAAMLAAARLDLALERATTLAQNGLDVIDGGTLQRAAVNARDLIADHRRSADPDELASLLTVLAEEAWDAARTPYETAIGAGSITEIAAETADGRIRISGEPTAAPVERATSNGWTGMVAGPLATILTDLLIADEVLAETTDHAPADAYPHLTQTAVELRDLAALAGRHLAELAALDDTADELAARRAILRSSAPTLITGRTGLHNAVGTAEAANAQARARALSAPAITALAEAAATARQRAGDLARSVGLDPDAIADDLTAPRAGRPIDPVIAALAIVPPGMADPEGAAEILRTHRAWLPRPQRPGSPAHEWQP